MMGAETSERRPRLVDLFSAAGGAARGYALAGFDVVGIDIVHQPEYPYEFVLADAIDYLDALIEADDWTDIDAIHASPPCQASCALTKGTNLGRVHPQLIPAVRERLARVPVPTVIENVQGSDLRRDLTLCGEMFGLGVLRHRYFECSFPIEQPSHPKHRGRVRGWRHGRWFDGPYFAVYGEGGGKGTVEEWQRAMGIDWINERKSLAEAIPPAYTEYVWRRLMEHIRQRLVPAATSTEATTA